MLDDLMVIPLTIQSRWCFHLVDRGGFNTDGFWLFMVYFVCSLPDSDQEKISILIEPNSVGHCDIIRLPIIQRFQFEIQTFQCLSINSNMAKFSELDRLPEIASINLMSVFHVRFMVWIGLAINFNCSMLAQKSCELEKADEIVLEFNYWMHIISFQTDQ